MFRRRCLTSEEFREVMRENTLRFERAMRALSADNRRHLEAMREESRTYFESLESRTQEIVAEGRAGRQALFKILDRMDNGGTAPAA